MINWYIEAPNSLQFMKKDSTSKKKPSKHQSVDGIMIASRSYQPSNLNKRPELGNVADKLDGFYPQRVTAELGKITDDDFMSKPDDVVAKAESQIAAEAPAKIDKSPEPTKQRRRWLPWRRKPREKKQRTRKQKILRWLILLLILAALAGAGYFGFKFWQTSHDVFHGGGQSAGLAECKDMTQLKKEGDCRINILLLGIGGPGHDGPNLTDTMILASIDPINNSVTLLSIPRDLWVQIPGYGTQKINAAYEYGLQNTTSKKTSDQIKAGFNLVDQTLQPIIGMTINYHVLVDFTAFKEAVNDVGGVTINVPETLYDPTIAWQNNNNPVIAVKGVQHMQGAQALLYARSRETSSDFARSQRQRALLVAIGDKALTLGTFSNPVRVSNLLDSFGQNVFTDFSLGNLKPLYNLVSNIPSYDITSMDLTTTPGNLITTGTMDGLSIDYPVAGLYNYSQIGAYVRASLRDGELAKENAPVAVYNATSLGGLAATQTAILQGYGYRISTTSTAPNTVDPAKTTLVDLSNGKDAYTRHYLENRLGTTAVTSLPAEYGIKPQPGTDFVIILGQDAATSSTTTTAAN